jgi:hypothetical protein
LKHEIEKRRKKMKEKKRGGKRKKEEKSTSFIIHINNERGVLHPKCFIIDSIYAN